MALYEVRGRRPGERSSTFLGMQDAHSPEQAVERIRRMTPHLRDVTATLRQGSELGPQNAGPYVPITHERRGLRSHPKGWRLG